LDKFEFIERVSSNLDHSDSTFFDHLWGTYSLLKKMGEPEYICDAGLYHSVYGTSYYDVSITVSREVVINLIGEVAENLVYIFCSLPDRTENLLNDRINPIDVHIDLLKIEYANLIEQNLRPNDISNDILAVRNKMIEMMYENSINN